MKNVVFTLSALILLSASEASSVDTEFGIWTDKTNQVAYGFLSNHEFIYMAQSDKGIWTKWEGAWNTGNEICSDGEQKQRVGNLLIYVGVVQCCMFLEMLGQNMFLSFVAPHNLAGRTGFCSNRVLTRVKNLPK